MEKCGNLAQQPVATASGRDAVFEACSACAGDYEDPDRTAWEVEEDDEPEPGNGEA